MSENSSAQNQGYRLIVVDDHDLFSEGLANLLRTLESVDQVELAKTAQELYSKLESVSYDVVLLDMIMPVSGGLEILKKLRIHFPSTKVLIVSQHSLSRDILDSVRLGAKGFIPKTARFTEVKLAVERVASGNEYFSKDIMRFIGQYNFNDLVELVETTRGVDLNERELAVLIAVCHQFSSEEISQKLGLSLSSIKKYRIGLMEKTQSQNSIGLLAYALKNGLIELNDV
jgi:DNA-binding NarL/FixJ family response regulator